MADEDDGFVSRWSRRKRDARREDGGAETPALEETPETDPEAGDPEVIAKLPDIDSLDENSDFSPFMAEGVPEILRRRALRKLWRLNPVLANLDGLNDYDEDFTDAANLLSEIKTVYKVGQGMVERRPEGTVPEATPESAETEEPGAEPPAEEPAAESAQSVAALPEAEETVIAGPEDEAVQPKAVQPKAVPREPAKRPSRGAAARRWGVPSEDSG